MPHGRILNGILWVLRTGAPWHDLPRHDGPAGTVSSRFYRWCASGLWDRVLSALQAEADARGEVDWGLHFGDATIIRAHQHAAGARRDGAIGGVAQAREALGRSQDGFSTKLHLRAEGNGRPITAVLTGGERHERIALEAVLYGGRDPPPWTGPAPLAASTSSRRQGLQQPDRPRPPAASAHSARHPQYE